MFIKGSPVPDSGGRILSTGINVIKLFTAVIYKWQNKISFLNRPSIRFEIKAREPTLFCSHLQTLD